MELILQDVRGQHYVEGPPGHALIERPEDVRVAIEACLYYSVYRLLLYHENLPDTFFDLSSGVAGEILQKLRNYRIRLAIVRTPTLRMSSRFGELLADEQRGPYLRLFDERQPAQEWLCVD